MAAVTKGVRATNGTGVTSGTGVTNGTGANDSIFGGWKNFEAAFKNSEAAFKTLQPLSNHIQRIESLTNEINVLKLELAEAKETVYSHSTQNAVLVKAHISEVEQLNEECAHLKNELEDSKKRNDLSRAKEARRHEIENNRARAKIADMEKKEKNISIELAGTKMKLDESHQKLGRLDEAIGWHKLGANFDEQITNLATSIHDLAQKYFFRSIPEKYDMDQLFEQLINSRFMKALEHEIPISNTSASRHLRVVAAASIITKNIVTNLFDASFLSSQEGGLILQKALARFDAKGPRQPMLRTLFLTAFSDEMNGHLKHSLKSIGTQLKLWFDPLLSLYEASDEFSEDLRSVLDNAAHVLDLALKSSTTVEFLMSGYEFDPYPEPQSVVEVHTENQDFLSAEETPVMILFPCVTMVGRENPVHRGYALWSESNLWVAGKEELKKQVARVRSLRDGTGSRRRRQSDDIGQHSVRRLLMGNPTTSMIKSGSFAERTDANARDKRRSS